jgi:mycothiol system anti-sigma-R factor
MSCGDPHDVDCSEVLDRVYVFIDQELVVEDDDGSVTAASYTRIRQHLEECAPCLREYDLERLVKALVARACACEHASDELRAKILARIAETRSAVGPLLSESGHTRSVI